MEITARWYGPCSKGLGKEVAEMYERVLRRVAVSELQIQLLLAGTALAAFAGLLVQDKIHPLLVYLLQLYLVF